MATLSTESTPRERLSRVLALLRRTRLFWRSTLALAVVGLAVSLVVALRSKRAWRSETTVLCRQEIKTEREAESAAARAARVGPKLKDLLTARPTLETLLTQFGLYPEKRGRSMLEAVEEMQTNIGFRARNSDTFVVSFIADDPDVAQQVTKRLAETMIHDYSRQNLDSASMTRDFLRRELDEANRKVDDASRALAIFLAKNPQFQWGTNDSPYAPVLPGTPTGVAAREAPGPRLPLRGPPGDPQLALLQRELARVEAELAPAAPAVPAAAAGLAPATPAVEAQKRRDAAAAVVAAAQANLADRLLAVTPAHPDAVSAALKLDAAKQALAEAEAALRATRSLAAEGASRAELDPARRAELEQQRGFLRRQITERAGRAVVEPEALPAPDAGGSGPGKPAAKVDVVELETEWHRLRLEIERARDQLHTVQADKHSADISADAVEKESQAAMTILEPAYRPPKPDRGHGRVFLVGATLTLFLALAYAASRVLLNDTLHDEGDVMALGGAPVLVVLPRMPGAPVLAARAMVPAPPRDLQRAAAPYHASATTPPPPAEPAPLQLTERASDAPPQVGPPAKGGRKRMATLRYGARPPVPVAELVAAALTPPPAAALVVRAEVGLLEAVLDEPEVEVIGADVDLEGDGVLGLLRTASPEALAALRVLRHRLDQRREGGAFVVSVVSPAAGEGKTTLAARLAMTLSEAERARVVLVEGNFERPCVTEALGLRLPETVGFSAQVRRHLGGRRGPWGVVRVSPSLAVLAEPDREAAFPGAVHSQHFRAAIDALRRYCDYIVVDGPAVLGSGDANVLEDVSDGVLLVARSAVTKGGALSRAGLQLGERRILGVVLNDVVLAKRGRRRGGRAGSLNPPAPRASRAPAGAAPEAASAPTKVSERRR